MKHTNHNHWLSIGFVALLSIILFRHLWVWPPQSAYVKLRSNTALIEAFSKGDMKAVTHLQQSETFEYQTYKNGRLINQSGDSLPLLRLVTQRPAAAHVITPTVSASLAAMQPYIIWIGIHRDIFFVLNGPDHSDTSYAIYKRVII